MQFQPEFCQNHFCIFHTDVLYQPVVYSCFFAFIFLAISLAFGMLYFANGDISFLRPYIPIIIKYSSQYRILQGVQYILQKKRLVSWVVSASGRDPFTGGLKHFLGNGNLELEERILRDRILFYCSYL